MADIRTKPNETLQMLKYRETDPQNQPQKPEGADGSKGRSRESPGGGIKFLLSFGYDDPRGAA